MVSLDSVSTNHLLVIGTAPVYSSNAASSSALFTERAVDFHGTNALRATAVTNVTDNFGLELWVKPRVATGQRCLAYNGNTAISGWGLYQVNGTFQVLYGGLTTFGDAPVVTNVWTHLALVRASGLATLYVNGVAAGSSAAGMNAPDGFLGLGAAPAAYSGEFMDGLLDEVRVFTFAPGAFSARMTSRSPRGRH